MDAITSQTSIPQSPQPSQVTAQPVSPHLSGYKARWIMIFLNILIGSFIAGCISTALILYLPYNRMVFYPQTRGTYVNVSSVRLKNPGFVSVYMKTSGGLLPVGSSNFLEPGYYPKIAIFIDTVAVQLDLGRELVVRMFEDNGNKKFDEPLDIPVRNVFGGLYEKKSSMFHPKNYFVEWWLYFLNDPLSVIGGILIP